MSIQVISKGKDGPKIGDFTVKNSFLESHKSPISLLNNMSVPYGLLYLQTYSSGVNKHHDVTDPSGVLEEFNSLTVDSAVRSNSGYVDDNNTEDVAVVDKTLFDKLLGIVDKIKDERKKRATRKKSKKHHTNKHRSKKTRKH